MSGHQHDKVQDQISDAHPVGSQNLVQGVEALDQAVEEHLDDQLDKVFWDNLVLAHGPAAQAALAAAKLRREAISTLPRTPAPTDLADRIIAALPSTAGQTPSRWWLPLGTAVLAAAALSLVLLLPDPHPMGETEPISDGLLLLDDLDNETHKEMMRPSSLRRRAQHSSSPVEPDARTLPAPALSAPELVVSEAQPQTSSVDSHIEEVVRSSQTKPQEVAGVFALSADVTDEVTAAQEDAPVAADEQIALLSEARSYIAGPGARARAEAPASEVLAAVRQKEGEPAASRLDLRLELQRNPDGTLTAFIHRPPERPWPNLMLIEGLDESGSVIWTRALAVAAEDVAEAEALTRRIELLLTLAPPVQVHGLRLGLDQFRSDIHSVP